MQRTKLFNSIVVVLFSVFINGCSGSRQWPEPPLFTIPENDSLWIGPEDIDEAMKMIAGHYAHFDVVAYEDVTTKTPMKTFVISYGFTDFFIEEGKLFQVDTFCHAEQKINQKFVKSLFKDESVQAIQPRIQEVELKYEKGQWQIYRPESPTLLGISGDPSLPLSRDPKDPRLTDPDNDGNPGVTVELKMWGLIKGELYITRREIYSNHLVLHSNGNLYGYIEDRSEQFVIDASMKILRQQSNPVQNPDRGMNPLILIRVSDEIDSCEELMDRRDLLFPDEPEFF